MTLYRRQGSRPSPRKRNAKGQMVVWGGLTNRWEKKRVKGKGEKERYNHLNAKFQRKSSLVVQMAKASAYNAGDPGLIPGSWRSPGEGWQPTPVLLSEKSHGRRSLVGYNPWGRWARHDWATSLPLFTFMHWRRKWQPTPVFLPGESQGRWSLVGCCLWGLTESDKIEVT